MEGYLIAAGIIVLVVGVLLAFFKGFCEKTGKALDRVIIVLDDVLNPYRILVGIVLALVGIWILYVIVVYRSYYLLHPVWVILVIGGLLFVFSPHLLGRISKVANKTVFSTEEAVRRSGRIIGLMFILAALYIFYTVYLIR